MNRRTAKKVLKLSGANLVKMVPWRFAWRHRGGTVIAASRRLGMPNGWEPR